MNVNYPQPPAPYSADHAKGYHSESYDNETVHSPQQPQPMQMEAHQYADSEPRLAGDNFDELSTKLSDNSRMPFIRKVYGILFGQFFITAIWIAIVASNQVGFITFFRAHPELLVLALVCELTCLYALGCYQSVARSVPTNYILLGIFTFSMSYAISYTTVLYEPVDIMAAAFLTAAVVGGLTLYALTTKTDYNVFAAFIWSMSLVLLATFILALFIRNRFMSLAVSVLVMMLLCVFIIYDTQLIFGEKSSQFSIDDYIFAAMVLYIDIMRLFLEILRILGKVKH